ncbi:MAG: TPM domain-containing protein [Deltaproteobacteria bacterium]|nr:MAG: TPM domain-containing protein [Deltaproteobacteria bacterium]
MKHLCTVTLACIALTPFGAVAQDMPSLENECLNDHAGLVKSADRRAIERICAKAKRDGATLMLVTVSSLDDFTPRPLNVDRFASRIFDEWDVGYEQARDAVMLFVARREREFRIVAGDGYPDRLRRRAVATIRARLVPQARRGRYSRGLRNTMQALYDKVVKPYVREKKRKLRRERMKRGILDGP